MENCLALDAFIVFIVDPIWKQCSEEHQHFNRVWITLIKTCNAFTLSALWKHEWTGLFWYSLNLLNEEILCNRLSFFSKASCYKSFFRVMYSHLLNLLLVRLILVLTCGTLRGMTKETLKTELYWTPRRSKINSLLLSFCPLQQKQQLSPGMCEKSDMWRLHSCVVWTLNRGLRRLEPGYNICFGNCSLKLTGWRKLKGIISR